MIFILGNFATTELQNTRVVYLLDNLDANVKCQQKYSKGKKGEFSKTLLSKDCFFSTGIHLFSPIRQHNTVYSGFTEMLS